MLRGFRFLVQGSGLTVLRFRGLRALVPAYIYCADCSKYSLNPKTLKGS